MRRKIVITVVSIWIIASLKIDALANDATTNYYVAARSFGTNPEADPPRYVRSLNETGSKNFENIDWIDIGLQYRVRFEDRDGDLRRSVNTVDDPILSRTRAYLAVKNILDPLRFTIELQDSRIANSKFTGTSREVDKVDFLQSYAELYFKNSFASKRSTSVRFGRMTLDILDRRLFGRNEWRNTTNSFQGFRTIIGHKEDDWQIDAFALQPVIISTNEANSVNKKLWLYGITTDIRKWSELVSLQGFYFKLDQQSSPLTTRKNINATGLRAFGNVADSGFDYDFIAIYQFGNANSKKQRAFASVSEVGYQFNQKWNPRVGLQYAYASGDSNPQDHDDETFETFFGTNHSWSANNYIQLRNLNAIRPRILLKPNKKLQIDSGYSFYWLASRKDSWNYTGLRDKSGNSGKAIGQEFDLRTRYKITNNLESEMGYSHFISGNFTKNLGKAKSSDFLYLQLTWSLF